MMSQLRHHWDIVEASLQHKWDIIRSSVECGASTGLLLSREYSSHDNILSNVRTNVRKYAVTWLKHSRESNRPLPGPKIEGIFFNMEKNFYIPSVWEHFFRKIIIWNVWKYFGGKNHYPKCLNIFEKKRAQHPHWTLQTFFSKISGVWKYITEKTIVWSILIHFWRKKSLPVAFRLPSTFENFRKKITIMSVQKYFSRKKMSHF